MCCVIPTKRWFCCCLLRHALCMCCILSGRHTHRCCAAADAWVTCVHVHRMLLLLLCRQHSQCAGRVPTYMPATAHRGQPGCLCGHRVVMMMLLPPLRACTCARTLLPLLGGHLVCRMCLLFRRICFGFAVCLMVGLSVAAVHVLHPHFGSIHKLASGGHLHPHVCMYVCLLLPPTYYTRVVGASHVVLEVPGLADPPHAEMHAQCVGCGRYLHVTCRQRGGRGGGGCGACVILLPGACCIVRMHVLQRGSQCGHSLSIRSRCGADMLTHSQPAWQPRLHTLLLPGHIVLRLVVWIACVAGRVCASRHTTRWHCLEVRVCCSPPKRLHAPPWWRRCTLYFAMAADPAQCHPPCLPSPACLGYGCVMLLRPLWRFASHL